MNTQNIQYVYVYMYERPPKQTKRTYVYDTHNATYPIYIILKVIHSWAA
jgi:hypothetical protein